MQFQILVFDGFEEMDVFGVFEPLRMAGFDVKLVSLEKQVCAGSMLLAKAGLLSGRSATSNLSLLDELGQGGVNAIQARVVDDGDIITAGGITGSLDLGVWLVQRFSNVDKALEVSRKLEFEPRGCVWQTKEKTKENDN
jgi:transcriptional regulator GlxA family with amidase domain